ncbi:hypothetical protein EXE06_09495 [Acinetobacter pittii]|nr:hypothetical protein EXE06_09495 [Acinetobacter pittii]RZH57906.1 hypothetical protein EXD88_04330 [Acinetobacter pittii]RZH60494.1 hypothetical protein EXD90_07920 [Acinetobacter pittii]
MAYVCETVELINNVQTCVSYIQFTPSWLDELNSLSRAEINKLLTEIIAFWLYCSGLRMLLEFIER